MKTYTVKVEYKSPKGSHMTYQGDHTGRTEGEAFLNTISHLQTKLKRQISGSLRMTALLKGESSDGMA